MHFSCVCGHRISDTSDCLPYSARLVADVDIYDYWEAWERRGRGQSLGILSNPMDYEQIIYQCEECGRLYFDDPDDPGHFIAFLPEDKNVMVTGPVQAESWRGYISAVSDLGMKRGIGCCYTNWHYGTGEEYREFASYETMREYFDAKLRELQEADRVKSAWVNKDGEIVFRWDLEDTEPVQEKFELYLTEEERAALEWFKQEHKDCHHKYPRGPRGWDFAYEVLPGICGAYDRDLKATCLRCGKSIASIDGEIVEEDSEVVAEYGDKTKMILNLLHDRGTRKARLESVSMPHRYYDVTEAIGYVRGLMDALSLFGEGEQLTAVFQHVASRLMDESETGYPVALRNLIRSASEDGDFDWVIEEAMPFIKKTLKEDFGSIDVEWTDEPNIVRE